MAKKYYWLKLKDGFFEDKIIKKLRRIAGGDTYVIIYLKMQLLSIKTEGKLYFEGVEDNFEEELALEIDEDVENVRVTVSYLEKLNLIESTIADEYVLPSVLELIGKESESAERVRLHRKNKNDYLLHCNTDVTNSNNDVIQCNTEIEKEKEKEKDIDINKNIVQTDCTVSKKEINYMFESLWMLYPNKKGKGQISDTKKKKLFEIGFDQLSVAIKRYQDELSKEEWRKAQNGSTFFNSGYIDYLDANFSPSERKKQIQKPQMANRFNSFPQREYSAADYANLERALINKSY